LGSDSDLDLGPNAARQSLKVLGPDGKEQLSIADEQGVLRDVTFLEPGVYSLREATGGERERIGVNVPVQESDLTSLSANDFDQQLARVQDTPQTTWTAGLFGAGSNRRELWRVLLVTLLVLLLGEMLVANRTLV